ncbi:hypothetical protein KHA93_04110 [Bacillus sp. FJAT-49732]|uniref:Lipoprotein n=1 Tax=Lederbergia citrisecunda TaxID=2833583 RepID=A0A942TIP6_9BACI|nr:hypothetical protein [Lederbergia citrisecunda]MBS4198836.1 hypothetical protein [Lederbergia citrisecunda]
MKKMMVCLFLFFLITGCRQKLPEPESYVAKASDHINKSPQLMDVRHIVDGRNVKIECIVSGVSFVNNIDHNYGKIIVYVDGLRHGEFTTPAFIIKNLSPGTHRLKIDVVKPNSQSFGINRQFMVKIN